MKFAPEVTSALRDGHAIDTPRFEALRRFAAVAAEGAKPSLDHALVVSSFDGILVHSAARSGLLGATPIQQGDLT